MNKELDKTRRATTTTTLELDNKQKSSLSYLVINLNDNNKRPLEQIECLLEACKERKKDLDLFKFKINKINDSWNRFNLILNENNDKIRGKFNNEIINNLNKSLNSLSIAVKHTKDSLNVIKRRKITIISSLMFIIISILILSIVIIT